MSEIEVFKAPAGLAKQLSEFFDHQDHHPLARLGDMRPALVPYIGVYALYYKGDHSL